MDQEEPLITMSSVARFSSQIFPFMPGGELIVDIPIPLLQALTAEEKAQFKQDLRAVVDAWLEKKGIGREP